MAKYTVVDEDDNPIGAKEKADMVANDIYRVSGLWLTNNKGEMLIAQRSFIKINGPGLWGPAVEGTVEDGETYEQNIIKEIWEELGLKRIRIIFGPKILYKVTHIKYYQMFTAQTDIKISDIIIQKDEVEQVKWITRQDLMKDVKAHPEKYVSHMRTALEMLYAEFKYL